MDLSQEAATPYTDVSTGTSDLAVKHIMDAAQRAFVTWRGTTPSDRVNGLRRLRLYIVSRLDEIASRIAEDTGKSAFEALSTEVLPVLEGIRHLEKHAVKALSPERVQTPLLLVGKHSYVSFQPRGVVLVISPWNFPFHLSMTPVLHAMAAGNSVILKPSEFTPDTGRLMEELFRGAGWPEHVVQVAHGGKELGAALVDAAPDYIFFTGSVPTGRIIQSAAAQKLIPTTLELGGKDPMVVFADAPLNRAVQGALWGGFMNAGQVCMSVERVYVERPLYEPFVAELVKEVGRLRHGRHVEDDIGHMTTDMQVNIVRDHVADALARAAVLETGQPPEEWAKNGSRVIPPIVLTNVSPEMKVMREETFGPVLPIVPFDSEEEAIALANGGSYGLSASVWSRNLERAKRVAAQLVSGNVLVNDVVITIVNQNLPFGGEKSSGIGRYHGKDSLRMFCVQTSTMVDSGKRKREVGWFPYQGKYADFAGLIRSYYGKSVRWLPFARHYLRLLKMGKR